MNFKDSISTYNKTNIQKMLKHTKDALSESEKVFEIMDMKPSITSKLEYLRAYIKFFEFHKYPTDDLYEKLIKLNKQNVFKPQENNKRLSTLFNEKKYREYVSEFLRIKYGFNGTFDNEHFLSPHNYIIKFQNGDKLHRIGHQKFIKAYNTI